MDAEKLLSRPTIGDRSPPSDVAPSELMRRLMATQPPSEILPFPRKGDDGQPVFEYRLRVLTQQEIDSCCANAEQYTRKLLQGQLKITDAEVKHVRAEAWAEIYNNARLVELIFEACRDKDDPSRHLFTAPGLIRKLLTADEQAAIYHAYELVQAKYGPLWSQLSDAQIEEWIDRVVKGADLHPLSQLGPVALAMLVISMAFRLRASTTDGGSSGLPSDAGATETSQTLPSEAEAIAALENLK